MPVENIEENEQIQDTNSDDIIKIEDITIKDPVKIDEEFYKKLDTIFNSYFTTLEEQQKKDEEVQKENDKLIENFNSNSEDFQSQLINEIKVLQDNQYITQEYLQYQNNLTFFGILMFLLIFVSTLIYKFFKTFI